MDVPFIILLLAISSALLYAGYVLLDNTFDQAPKKTNRYTRSARQSKKQHPRIN